MSWPANAGHPGDADSFVGFEPASPGWPTLRWAMTRTACLCCTLQDHAFLAFAGGDKDLQLFEATGPAAIVSVAVSFAGEAFMAEMHFGLAAHITQEDGDQGRVFAMFPLPGESQARWVFQHLEDASRRELGAVRAVHHHAEAPAHAWLQQGDFALDFARAGPGAPILFVGEAGEDAGWRCVEGAG